MTEHQKRYENAKKKLLSDDSVNLSNRELFERFFAYEEHKLKRVNNLRQLDVGAYRTLYGYIVKFRNINAWFENKAWTALTKEDIQLVYDGLEDGHIKRRNGKPYENLNSSYYCKVFKSKPFEMAGKETLAREIIQFTGKQSKAVRFITEEDYQKIVFNVNKPLHKLLLWLAWDIGENINALLQLKKSDFTLQQDPNTKEPEYRINLRKEILKRSRTSRSEITNYKETVLLLDQILANLKEDELLFDFEYRNAKKIIDRPVERSGVRCIPNKEKPTWKDLRSGMACDLLKKGYHTDEVNARLGHRPSSDEIDKYVNFLALDRHVTKKKVHQFEMEKLTEEMAKIAQREKLQTLRAETLEAQLKQQQEQILETTKTFERINKFMNRVAKEDPTLIHLLAGAAARVKKE